MELKGEDESVITLLQWYFKSHFAVKTPLIHCIFYLIYCIS